MTMPGTLGLSFADAVSQAAQSGAPVVFGGTNIGSGSAGGGSGTYSPTANPKGDATAVTPVTSLPGLSDLFGGGGGESGPADLLGSTVPALASYAMQGMGFNGGQVQDPKAVSAIYGTPTKEVAAAKTAESSFLPGPIALGAIALVVAVSGFLIFRG